MIVVGVGAHIKAGVAGGWRATTRGRKSCGDVASGWCLGGVWVVFLGKL